jgi:hypothetical protein
MTALSRLSHLNHLKISVQSNNYSDSVLLSSKSSENSRELHEQLWWHFLDHGHTSELITITLRFWRWENLFFEQRDDRSNCVKIKQVFHISSKPKPGRDLFDLKIKLLGKADNFSVYGVKFQDCDGIS